MIYSFEHAQHKWTGSTPYFEPGSAYMLYVQDTETDIPDAYLVEANRYEDGTAHLFVLRRPGSRLRWKRGRGVPLRLPLDVALVATDSYAPQLERAHAHYTALPSSIVRSVQVARASDIGFSLARMRNESVARCTAETVLVGDLDCLITAAEIQELVQIPDHEGVLVLKHTIQDGNGNLLAQRSLLSEVPCYPRFEGIWREDTEWLMALSRAGVTPMVVFRPFAWHPSTNVGRADHLNNFELMREIIHHGRGD